MDTIEAKKKQFLKCLGENTAWDTQKYEKIHQVGAELGWTPAETDSLGRELDSEGCTEFATGRTG